MCSGSALQISDGSGIAERQCFGLEGMCFIPDGSPCSCRECAVPVLTSGWVLLGATSECC